MKTAFEISLEYAVATKPNHPVANLIAALFLGMGLGSQLALLSANRDRLRAVFRPNTGRVLSALTLALCIPLAMFGYSPATFLWLFSLLLSGASSMNGPELSLYLSAFVLVALPVAFVFSSLIISGTQSCLIRILLFGQTWLAAFGAAMLVFGFQRFSL